MKSIIPAFLIVFLSCHLVKDKIKSKPPNLIVIMTDDMGWADVGFNGCKDIPTPNIDQIAKEGVRFEDGYVTFPVCGPSRAGFLTGRYQDRFGFTTNPSINPSNAISGLPVQEETMAQVLRKANYKNAIIGKWHMGTNAVFHPLERGFDYFYGFLSGGHNYLPERLNIKDLSEVKRKWQWYSTKIIENRKPVEIDDYLTDELSNAAVQFINKKANQEEPFMVYLAYNAPHAPLQATEKYLSRFPDIKDKKRKTYAAMVSAVDDGVGNILRTLKKNGIDENTIVVFLSDNGGPEQKNASDNGLLKGGKSDLFEGGIRVPFAMRWKGVIPENQTYTHPVSSLDIMATIVAQNDIKINKDRPLDGVNLIPFLTGKNKSKPHDMLFWRKWEQNAMAIRQGNYKLVSNTQQQKNKPKLFDISKDISEKTNIQLSKKELHNILLKEWNIWNDQMKDRVFPTLSEDIWWTNKD
ncbi:MAG: sulfatase-like hydrolase/transferase [Algibacter sp.]|uniref:sulfatase-like hydrolase/transferase n=1 Tax=Algibacter sp. TaxID=1872428 RepID=UPI0026031A0B|nr:sulfatase-like hydrolase/transferase [Algibacter sp.]MDG1731253.1 sulfatase-like hydrolase/transferase [Algibacter sp.]MDG2178806.1 sulfatase-like hydrolase/transferase [Algibacter sp.]|tara:strand:+ start:27985 stop:29382 length:1398 start_codon:yes stop_codon:yes gene_type:complete